MLNFIVKRTLGELLMRLLSARIKNFKSLEDVTLKFRDLTIIVGANASGKSNCLDALSIFGQFVQIGSPPPRKLAESLFTIKAQENLALAGNFMTLIPLRCVVVSVLSNFI